MTLVYLQQVKSKRTKWIEFIYGDGCNAIVRFHGIILWMQPVDSFKRWPKRISLFKTIDGRTIIGLERMIMVTLTNIKYMSIPFYYCP